MMASSGPFTRLRVDTTEVKDQWAFTADGTMTFDENKPDARAEEDHVTGSYTASDGVIVATATNTNAPGNVRVTFTYYAERCFSSHAMRALGGARRDRRRVDADRPRSRTWTTPPRWPTEASRRASSAPMERSTGWPPPITAVRA
jgi:hypothetical protein